VTRTFVQNLKAPTPFAESDVLVISMLTISFLEAVLYPEKP
jgi:hypothetical protein